MKATKEIKWLSCLLIAFLAAAPILTVRANGVDDWPMFHHDLANTGYSTSSGPSTNETLWTYPLEPMMRCSPAISGGYIYFGAFGAIFYCLDALTGAHVWNYTVGAPVVSSPAVADGKVYFGCFDGYVYCLDALTGEYLWDYNTGDTLNAAPKVAGGYLYIVNSANYYLFCLDATTGAQVWNSTTAIDGSPAIVGDYLYIGMGNMGLECLNATDGSLIWLFYTSDLVVCSPAVDDGLVYFGAWDGIVYCLNSTTGDGVWSYQTGGAIESSPAVVGGLVYIGSSDWNVYALDSATGGLIWNCTISGPVSSSPAVADGKVYVNSENQDMYCLDSATGALVWTYIPGFYGFSASPSIANGYVYAGSIEGGMYCFGASASPPTWSLTVTSGHDTPNPSVGAHTYADNETVKCNVTSPVVESGHSWNCTGWTGTGSVPASGDETTTTFSITENSTITWVWAEIVAYPVTFKLDIGDTAKGNLYEVDGVPYAREEILWFTNNTDHTFKFYSPIGGDYGEKYLWNSTTGLATTRSGTITVTGSGELYATYTWTESAVTPEDWFDILLFGWGRWIFMLAIIVVVVLLAINPLTSILAMFLMVFFSLEYLTASAGSTDNLICGIILAGLSVFLLLAAIRGVKQ